MKPRIFLLVSPLLLAACAYDSGQPTASSQVVDSSQVDGLAMNGQAAYSEYCAGCHETGMMGAPIAGDAMDWGTRSRLWDAVLLDHAITGYLEMPARGGRMDLPEELVKSAAEYMLRVTFPDMPHDCNPPSCGDPQE